MFRFTHYNYVVIPNNDASKQTTVIIALQVCHIFLTLHLSSNVCIPAVKRLGTPSGDLDMKMYRCKAKTMKELIIKGNILSILWVISNATLLFLSEKWLFVQVCSAILTKYLYLDLKFDTRSPDHCIVSCCCCLQVNLNSAEDLLWLLWKVKVKQQSGNCGYSLPPRVGTLNSLHCAEQLLTETEVFRRLTSHQSCIQNIQHIKYFYLGLKMCDK